MATQDQHAPFTVKISITESTPHKIACEVTITNSGGKDYELLCRHTPLEGLTSDIFNVQLKGKGTIPYDGILLKRAPPSDEEYVLIKAKSSEKEKVNLKQAYCINFPGSYTVQLKMNLKFREPNEGKTSVTQKVDSNTVEFIVTDEEQTGKTTKRIEPDGDKGTPLYKDGPALSGFSGPKSPLLAGKYPNPRDKGETKHAYKLAYSAIERSIPSTTENPELYKEWFGDPYNPTVKSNYKTMKSAMDEREFTLHALPTEKENKHTPKTSYHGFTYKDSTTIYLGDRYFAAHVEGTDSKTGTIVHEMSHAAAGTKDFEYGQENCRNLAENHSEMASLNADNYEYFSEAQK